MTAYATITPAAREAFAMAMMEINQAQRSFSSSFTTADALKAACASLERAAKGLRTTRALIR